MKYQSKHTIILDQCKGRKILHLGCVGNNDFNTAHKVAASPSTLHIKLSESAVVTGVDISAEAIEEYRRNGICDNILAGDAERLGEIGLEKDYDVIVVGDLIEHLSNPGMMLDGVRALCRQDTRVIITTPNAFGLAPFLRHLSGKFREGDQHVMTFNDQNLRNFVNRHGFEIEDIGTCHQAESEKNTLTFRLGKRLFERFPKLGGTLVFILRPTGN